MKGLKTEDELETANSNNEEDEPETADSVEGRSESEAPNSIKMFDWKEPNLR